MFEMLIARNCAPALAGIKPSNIATCRKADFADVHEEVAHINRELNLRGIFVEILCECEVSALIIVYRKSVLCAHLQNRSNRAFLARYGYGEASGLEEYIDILKSRLGCDKFPHETGVLLGYPLRDIHCFIHHPKEGALWWETGECIIMRRRRAEPFVGSRLAKGLWHKRLPTAERWRKYSVRLELADKFVDLCRRLLYKKLFNGGFIS